METAEANLAMGTATAALTDSQDETEALVQRSARASVVDADDVERIVKQIAERRGRRNEEGGYEQNLTEGLTDYNAMSLALQSAQETEAEMMVWTDAVHVIERESDQACIEMLSIAKKLGFDVNTNDKDGQTLLMRSSRLGRSVVVQELMHLNADVNVVNEVVEVHWSGESETACKVDGSTAVIQAAQAKHSDTTSLLIRAKADCSIVDHVREDLVWRVHDSLRRMELTPCDMQ
eukprot:14362-Hanusia_phi.AAC.4